MSKLLISVQSLPTDSTAPGVQLYTANYLSGSENRSICKTDYQAWSGVCLETQHFPDSIIDSGKDYKVDPEFLAGKCPILTPQSPNYSQCIDYCLETEEKAAAETSGSDTLSQKYASVEDMWLAQDLTTWYKQAKEYYEDNCAATIEGVLGGIGWISDTDLSTLCSSVCAGLALHLTILSNSFHARWIARIFKRNSTTQNRNHFRGV